MEARCHGERVWVLDGKRLRADGSHPFGHVSIRRLRQRQLAELVLDRDLPRAGRRQQQLIALVLAPLVKAASLPAAGIIGSYC